MEYENSSNIIYCVENGLLKITLNRPEKKNAITNSMYKNLLEIFHKSIQDNTIHTVCLTGTGNFFSSGNDFVSLLTNQDVFDIKSIINDFKKFIDMLITYPKLLIAVVNGPAIGIAVTILPLFDITYASDTAYFQTPFTSLGLIAEGCSTYTFPKIFGKSKASDMLYLGYKMNAFEAKQYGLVSEIYKYECLDEVWIYLKKLTKLSLKSILAIKHLVKKWNQNILLEVNAEECTELIKHIQSSDFIERLKNFILHKSKI
ncbi:enoyl-CoA delta isomerase 3, peroxisomal-like isoform X1 [Apis dorsata]|uniref:enoyl-CoA delta isomerase 3, peroxisomal-like isoform X1 n=1 Tax=Apis dorsata TaxID=7462 RepID=UPI0003DF68E4|nr:enoyl-CoA delta isomerase 3, peroxisomal-like isoform X1 [Apis dorsata]